MTDYEKLGVFYLGKLYDMSARTRQPELLLYDSKDLTTHAVCVGMTGSGKTGLCLSLIEEAAIDGIPAILIDPKGDLSNLLLTFPDLQPADFAPWVNPAEAESKGMSVTDYAAAQAELWRKGLAEWDQDGTRIRRLHEAVDMAIYTPGSSAGLPVSLLSSFAVPDANTLNDSEALHDRIGTTVASLLSLVGIDADPIQSREYILLATILDRAWRAGQNVDLAALIQQVQSPPVTTIGVLDLETFYPTKDRFGLVMALNNLLASPGFQNWLVGDPLDINRILFGPTGKPRIAIFSTAHLSDAERMFFVALLLNQIVGWVRGLSGTTSLRALVYMDEIFGYFPPTANPPSKQPLLTLLKQARAFGVGIMLATQNPVDLDYKGLANCGTWFVGRLQAERDKMRLLDGLESVNAGAGHVFDRQMIDKTLSSLSSRIFLINNVHEDAPAIFQTRWALSYLRGPLTQDHIRTLMAPLKQGEAQAPAAASMQAAAASTAVPVEAAPVAAASAVESVPDGLSRTPAIAQEVPTYFLPARRRASAEATLVYEPMLLGIAAVRFENTKQKLSETRTVSRLTTIKPSAVAVDWSEAEEVALEPSSLEKIGEAEALYRELPPAAGKSKSYTGWGRDLIDWLYGNELMNLFSHDRLGVTSQPGEAERDFRIRISQVAREQRDAALEQLRDKYNDKREQLEEKVRKAEQVKAREAEQANSAKIQSVMSLGGTLLDAFLGRKRLSKTTLNKATTAARGVGRAYGQSQDVARADENIAVLKKEIEALNAEFMEETSQLESQYDPLALSFETVVVKPLKKNINVQLLALAWVPTWQDKFGNSQPAWE